MIYHVISAKNLFLSKYNNIHLNLLTVICNKYNNKYNLYLNLSSLFKDFINGTIIYFFPKYYLTRCFLYFDVHSRIIHMNDFFLRFFKHKVAVTTDIRRLNMPLYVRSPNFGISDTLRHS